MLGISFTYLQESLPQKESKAKPSPLRFVIFGKLLKLLLASFLGYNICP